jgi:type IV pilus assembly protein PilP
MTRWYLCLICGVFILAGLIGCSEEPSPPPQKRTAAVATPPAKKLPTPDVKQQGEAAQASEFTYVSEGRRDPFVPLSKIRRPMEEAPAEPVTPLQSFDLGQFRLVGLIIGKGAAKAMVTAPDGKSYILAKGIKIGKNNGVVIDITKEAVVVKEKYYDFSGNVIENLLEITVPKREGV